jgi:hypothetical protein
MYVIANCKTVVIVTVCMIEVPTPGHLGSAVEEGSIVKNCLATIEIGGPSCGALTDTDALA